MTDSRPETPTDDERRVADAFAAFRDSHRDSFTPPPVEQVYAEARRQRQQRHHRTALAAAAALVLVVGLTALFTTIGSDQHTPSASGGNRASETPANSATPSRPGASGTADGTKDPDGRNPSRPRGTQLANATVELPPMNGCDGGTLQFSNGQANDGGCDWVIAYGNPRYANLDGSGRPEIVTKVTAGGGAAVAALQVPRTGPLSTMGYVVVTEPGTQDIESITVSNDGLVSVELSDSTYSARSPQRQTRGYRWAASARAFVQVEGPTSFPSPDPGPSEPPTSPSPSGDDGF